MAWRSSGATNTELVDNLVQNGLITNSEVERGFRNVDRKYFVPKGCEDEAYTDSPVRGGTSGGRGGAVHISAPHIYCTVLEALDLIPNSSLSFLNIGSGSGYLTCIASEILGPKSIYYGVEINKEVLAHCKQAVEAWHSESSLPSSSSRDNSNSNSNTSTSTMPLMYFIHGNGLNIQPDAGESASGFDRIYTGAAISQSQRKKLQQLLSPGGILVAPVASELLKITRTTIGSSSTIDIDEDDVTTTIDTDVEFTIEKITDVHFAPLLSLPRKNTILPRAQWSTANHHLYPESFQRAIKTLLLCRNSNAVQPLVEIKVKKEREEHINLSASLPKEVWLHILSFTTRKWFEPPKSDVELLQEETEILRQNLFRERETLRQTRQNLCRVESRNRILQRKNEIHRSIARQFHHHLENILVLQGQGGTGNANGRENTSLSLSPEIMSSMQALLEQSRNTLFNAELNRIDASFEMMMEEDDEDDSDGDESESDNDNNFNDNDDNDDEEMSFVSDSHFSVEDSQGLGQSHDDNHAMVEDHHPSVENARQVRTVSITSVDL